MKKSLGYKSRSLWKGCFLKPYLKKNLYFNRIYVVKQKDVGSVFFIHNGIKFVKLMISLKHVGTRLGQLVTTKKLGMNIHYKYSIKKKNKNKKKSK